MQNLWAVVATIVIQSAGALVTYGLVTGNVKEHERRLNVMEPELKEHGEDIAVLKSRRIQAQAHAQAAQ